MQPPGRNPRPQDFAAAGRWDAEHGLMPMDAFSLGSPAREAYAEGYRSGPGLGFKPNPYRDARRPQDGQHLRLDQHPRELAD